MPEHVFSISENALLGMTETHASSIFSHNKGFLMRVYPFGLRVSSSNLDPSIFWRKGVQMVALNWQKWDRGMMLNEGMFAETAGWVLKPSYYRQQAQLGSADVVGSATPTGHDAATAESQNKPDGALVNLANIPREIINLKITLFCGQDIPLPLDDTSDKSFRPYVKCELHVESAEPRIEELMQGSRKSKEAQFKTRSRTSRNSNPDFLGETLQFNNVKDVFEELTFLR
jgi:hypothetical protein